MTEITDEEVRELLDIEGMKRAAMGIRDSHPCDLKEGPVKKYLIVESAEPITDRMFKLVETDARRGRRVTILIPRGTSYEIAYELLLDKDHLDF